MRLLQEGAQVAMVPALSQVGLRLGGLFWLALSRRIAKMMAPIPDAITKRVVRLQQKGWPSIVEFPQGRQRLWISLEEATVAQLEQAVELETRAARKAILRFIETGSKHTAARAALRINRARAFAEWSLVSQGREVVEASLPFPMMSVEEMGETLRREREE